jgi:sugar phosphate isomerase/epimerase
LELSGKGSFLILGVVKASKPAAASPSVQPPVQDAPKVVQPIVPHRYKISACDWMMLKRQKLGAVQLAKDIGADGVELDMGSLGTRPTFENALSDPAQRAAFLDKANSLGIEFSSLAMSGFYAQSLAKRENYERIIQDCLDTMQQMKIRVAFLPLGIQGDLVKYPDLRPVLVERLKRIGARAQKAGVIIGIETSLEAREEAKFLDEIGSPAIRSYFNFENALHNKRDLISELRILGKDRIVQIHCTDEDGVWLQDNTRLDMPKVKAALDEMGWSGWLVIERSRDAKDPKNVRKNFGANAAYLKKVFQ